MPTFTPPPGFGPLPRSSPVLDGLGGFFSRGEGQSLEIGLQVGPNHLNGRGLLHGGVIATLMDVGIGYLLVARSGGRRWVTARLSVDFRATAAPGEWLQVQLDAVREQGRKAEASARLMAGERRVAEATALFIEAAPKPDADAAGHAQGEGAAAPTAAPSAAPSAAPAPAPAPAPSAAPWPDDPDFAPDAEGLRIALARLCAPASPPDPAAAAEPWPGQLPEQGIGAAAALHALAPQVLGGAARLGEPTAFAHMDPPTPWVTWAATQWNAALNQNLLHPATAPVARAIEAQVVAWLAPWFGMGGGHMTPGSTLANLTALWAARDCAGVREVLASSAAHLSVAKAAHILGLAYCALPVDAEGALRADALPADLSRSALVLTAGATSTGAIDPLSLAGRAAWTHVDAAWAGPLRLTRHAAVLDGVQAADSVAVSAHKWLFQPKPSALVLFREAERAEAAIRFGGAYLAVPNVGVMGSQGAMAVPLMAMLLAWGREGLAARIEHAMALAEGFAAFVRAQPGLQLWGEPRSGVVVWRPRDAARFEPLVHALPAQLASTTQIDGQRWLRQVAANPNADLQRLQAAVLQALARV